MLSWKGFKILAVPGRDTGASLICMTSLLFAAGRGLQRVRLTVGGTSLLAATTHLESPQGLGHMNTAFRAGQCEEVRS